MVTKYNFNKSTRASEYENKEDKVPFLFFEKAE